MILAKKKEQSQFNYIALPKQTKKPKPGLKAKGKLLLVAFVLCNFALGLFISAQFAQIAALGYQINQLQKEIKAMEKSNERERLEITKLQSLERIEKIATQKLGMVKPQQIVQLPIEQGQQAEWQHIGENSREKNLQVAQQNDLSQDQETPKRNPVIQAFSRLISGWAEGVR